MTRSSPLAIPWSLYLKWILANGLGLAAGEVIGFTLYVVLGSVALQVAGESVAGVIALLALMLAQGAVLGFSQRLLTRTDFTLPARWILLTALGWAGGYLFGTINAAALTSAVGELWSSVLAWLSVGVCLGLAQYLILRDVVRQAGWWIAINAGGWVAGQPIAGLAMSLLAGALGLSAMTGATADPTQATVVITAQLAGRALVGAAAALFTGLGLIWLLRRPLDVKAARD